MTNAPKGYMPRTIYGGYDPASKVDRSAFILLELMPDGVLETRMAINLAGIGYLEQSKEIINICKRHGITTLAVDGTSNSQLVDTLSKAFPGRVLNVVFTRPVKEQMMTDLRISFQEKTIRLGRNFKHYRLLCKELQELDPKRLDHPKGGSSDFAWSLALAIHASKFRFSPARRRYVTFMER